MKIADVLRKMADAIEREENGAAPDEKIQNPAALGPINTGIAVGTVNNQDAGCDDDVMVPPLQLKTELLKRAVGVDNIYDPGEARADQVHDVPQQDELALLKSRAGIPVAAVMELDNEEPLDD